jgi:uncharacterized protein YceK
MTKLVLFALMLSITIALSGCSSSEKRPDSFNEVVVMLDASGTYKKRQAEAIVKTSALLDTISQTKVRRWENAEDKITIITVDAVPEVIWQGTIRDLKAMKQSDWAERFKARTDYEKCTDVEAAFKLVSTHLQGDPQYVNKYVFAFTDLIHEPPAGSIGSCQPPKKPSTPSEEFPWGDFQDVSVSVFWVPPDQKLAWQRAAANHGLVTSFSLYTTSESGQVKISPPPKATPKNAEEEREADRVAYTQSFYSVIKWAVIILMGFGLLVVILLLVAKQMRGGRLASHRKSDIRREVPPLPASRLRRLGTVPQSGARPTASQGGQRQQ